MLDKVQKPNNSECYELIFYLLVNFELFCASCRAVHLSLYTLVRYTLTREHYQERFVVFYEV
jgi:hypothetical protein